MSHRHHHRRHHGHDGIPPIPPIPPIDMHGARTFNFDDIRRFFTGGRGGWGPFHFEFDDGHRDHQPRGRGRKRMFEGGELRLVLLKLIADQPRHGYELIKAIEEMTAGAYAPSPGVVYPTLSMLEDIGFIAEADVPDAKRTYEATDSGRTHLEENAEEVEALIDRLSGIGRRREAQQAGPAIGRSVKNLMYALKTRVAHDGWDEELLNEIVDILDSAAQRIERVKPASTSDQ